MTGTLFRITTYLPDLFSLMFILFFIFFIGVFIYSIVRGGRQWHHNNQQPRLSGEAKVVSKRSMCHHSRNSTSTTQYFVTFEVESGDRMEMTVNGWEYGELAEGDFGKLKFQGTRYLGFGRQQANY